MASKTLVSDQPLQGASWSDGRRLSHRRHPRLDAVQPVGVLDHDAADRGVVQLVGVQQIRRGAGENAVPMGIVGGEDDRVGVALHGEPEAGLDLLRRDVALAGEVLRRLEAEAAAVEAEDLEMLVEAVQIRHDPRCAAFEECDLQLRMPLEDAVGDHRGEGHHLLGREVHGMHGAEVVAVAVA